MPFLEAYPLRHQGPRTDLSVAYLNATLNATNAAVVNASETSSGYSISRTGVGTFTVTFKKCRYCKIIPVFTAVTGTNGRVPRVIAGFDPGAGTCSLELSLTASGAAADAAAESSELELIFLSGF